MTNIRSREFSLDQALLDPGFTPRQRDVSALIELVEVGDPEQRSAAEKALLRVQSSIDRQVATRARAVDGEALSRLLRLASQLVARAEDPSALSDAMIHALGSEDPRARRAAATALGRVKRPESEAALLEALSREPSVDARASRDPRVTEAIVVALGKVGNSARARKALADLAVRNLDESAIDKAKLMLDRTQHRESPSRLALERSLGEPLQMTLRCREGLEKILVSELPKDLDPRIAEGDRGRVDITTMRAPAELFRARTFLCFGFAFETSLRANGDLGDAVTDILVGARARLVLRTFTEGPIRFRVTWANGGKKRKAIWDLAKSMKARAPELINDPTDSVWDAVVRVTATGRARVELVPRASDPRFTYREADVPAASHPTLAAALVRAAGIREDDVVWDPFVGSGSELCERSLAGAFGMLIGSDIDDRALEAAKKNLERAGAGSAILRRADARSFDPRAIGGRARGGMSLIITNPPMGRRVARGEDLEGLLRGLVTKASEVLTRDGRLVWLSPLPRATMAAAAKHGLAVRSRTVVDMGGFPAELQILTRS